MAVNFTTTSNSINSFPKNKSQGFMSSLSIEVIT